MRQPHRGRGGSRHVGRIRIKAAKILSEHLGWEVFPEEIKPATGAYRTSIYEDVYRWELFTQKDRNPNAPLIIGCWEPLTNFVKLATKHGFHIADDVVYLGKELDE